MKPPDPRHSSPEPYQGKGYKVFEGQRILRKGRQIWQK